MIQDSATFWFDADLDGLQCLRATYVRHRFSPHVHDEFAIGVIERGAQRVRVRGGHEVMPERTVCVINPYESHTGHAAVESGWTYRMIYPGRDALRQVASHISGRNAGTPRFKDLVIQDSELMSRLLHLHRVLEEGRSTRLARQSLLATFLAGLIERHTEDRPVPEKAPAPDRRILRARDYLRENCPDPVGLDDLAAVAGLSPYHFMRSFKKALGVTAHAYQIHCRVEKAKRLLAAGTPIAEAASLAGFADQSHLTHRFRAVAGITPGRYVAGSRILQDPSAGT